MISFDLLGLPWQHWINDRNFKQVFFLTIMFCLYKVSKNSKIIQTAVWPNFFLMNVFLALKGSKFLDIICCHCSWMLCHVTAVKRLPALIYSADYILLLVL